MRRFNILLRLSWQLLRLRFSREGQEPHASKRLLFNTFRHLGGIYVKFLQILILNVDFLQGWASPSEFEVFEAVDYETIDLPLVLSRAIPNYQQVFKTINAQPFAAGSFAQVYLAELQDGRMVILKVLRPSLVRHIKGDLKLLAVLTRLSSWLYPQSLVNIHGIYQQFATTVLAETDYRREVANAHWFRDYFQDSAEVVVPETYANLSNDQLIVQEYIGGLSLAKVFEARRRGVNPAQLVQAEVGSDVWVQLETLGTVLLSATFTADFVLGDPHPGNIKLLPDNKIGLIDFGIIASPPANRSAFLELIREYEKIYAGSFDAGAYLLAAFKFFDEDLLEALQKSSQYMTPEKPDAIINSLKQAAADIFAFNANNQQTEQLLKRKMISRLFTQTINKNNRFGVHLNLESGVMMRSATTYLSMLGNLSMDGENFETIHRAMKRTIALADAGMAQEQPRTELSLEQSFEMASSWLARVADRDPFLYQQIAASMAV